MQKDVLLIAHFSSDLNKDGNNRFNYLANLFSDQNLDVELVTSGFSHSSKVARVKSDIQKSKYKLKLIHEPPYRKNVSLRRFYSHYMMARNLKKYLETRKRPDVIYCAVPSLSVAKVAAKFARKENIRFVIDVQDIWPEAFKMVFNVPYLSPMIFYPMTRTANYIYASADEIIAVSDSYKTRAMTNNTNPHENHVAVYLGTDLDKFDESSVASLTRRKPSKQLKIAYIGTLGSSYDLTSVIDAIALLNERNTPDIKFIVMGEGPLKEKFVSHARFKKINAEFTGKLEYSDMAARLKTCDIAVNPIRAGSAGSIINKVCDYAAAGLPVVNTQESTEYRELLEEYNAGLSCENGNLNDLVDKLSILIDNESLRIEMGRNNRRMAELKFDRRKTYEEIVNMILV